LTDAHPPIDVIVLAGDRGRDDPLAVAAEVAGKALVPVAGVPMLTRVLASLGRWQRLGRLILVAQERDDYRAAVADAGFDSRIDLRWMKPAASLIDSVETALSATASECRILLTADHALLRTRWLDDLLGRAMNHPAALSVGLADWHSVMRRFPNSRRTRYRFRDASVCGTNLFVLKNDPDVLNILYTWRKAEQNRKKPWRIVSLLGWSNLGLYLSGRLTLERAFSALSARVGCAVQPVAMDDPLTAVDVDTPADLELVERVLRADEDQRC